MVNLDRPVAPDPYSLLPELPAFTLVSNDFVDGGTLGRGQTAAGGGVSPHLAWRGEPAGTASFAVTCFDPDAPTPSGWWHWVLVDVPADVHELAAGAASAPLPSGAFQVPVDSGGPGFFGAAPPRGDRPHRYFFAVHALDVPTLGVDAHATPAAVSFHITFHAIGRAVIHGTWQS